MYNKNVISAAVYIFKIINFMLEKKRKETNLSLGDDNDIHNFVKISPWNPSLSQPARILL